MFTSSGFSFQPVFVVQPLSSRKTLCRPRKSSESQGHLYTGTAEVTPCLMVARGSCRSSCFSRSFHETEPAAQAPLEHSGGQKGLEYAKSSRFPADQMAKLGRFAGHDPTHACCDLGSVDSPLDVARETLAKNSPQFLVGSQRGGHGVRIRRQVAEVYLR